MVCILKGEGMSQQDLSRKLGLYAPRMVALIDGLDTVASWNGPSARRTDDAIWSVHRSKVASHGAWMKRSVVS